MTRSGFVLVLGKAPVPGFAKTRLTPPATPEQAADLAAAALLDTLDAALATGMPVVVAFTGDLGAAHRAAEIRAMLRSCTVIGQRGDGLAERLVHAHADSATVHPGSGVLQIGMDTPQLTPDLLTDAFDQLTADGLDAVLGPATDGGWWALGLRDPRRANALAEVAMSTSSTGDLTGKALLADGLSVGELPELSDVDTMVDAIRVAARSPHGRFAAAVAALSSA